MAQALGITLDQGFNLRNSTDLVQRMFRCPCPCQSSHPRHLYVYGETDAQTTQAASTLCGAGYQHIAELLED